MMFLSAFFYERIFLIDLINTVQFKAFPSYWHRGKVTIRCVHSFRPGLQRADSDVAHYQEKGLRGFQRFPKPSPQL